MRVSLSPLLQRAVVGLFVGRFVFAELFELGHIAVALVPVWGLGKISRLGAALTRSREVDVLIVGYAFDDKPARTLDS